MCLPADDKLLDWLAQGVAEGRITQSTAQDILRRRIRAIFGDWPKVEVTSTDPLCDHFRAWKLNNTDRKPVNFCPDCGRNLEVY